MKKRIIGLDILRDIGVIFIFFYHFFVEYIVTAHGEDVSFLNLNFFFNILARPASLFLFIISGYALMYNKEDSLSLGKYYIRRIKSLFIPFYVTYTLMFVICFLVNHEAPGKNLPLKLFGWTLIGMDGVKQITEANFYLVGEWFMSCIVICYLLFPLLAKLLRKFKYITLAVLLIWYVIILFFYNPFDYTPLMNPLFIIVYFYLGMFLHETMGEKEISTPIRGITLGLSILIFVYHMLYGYAPALAFLRLNASFTEALHFVWSILLFVALRDVNVKEDSGLYKSIIYLSGISWYIILTHHRIMILFYSHYDVSDYNHRDMAALLLACLISTFIASEVVRKITIKTKSILFNK
ncbi:MAG: acyltransferase [Pseudobutyrivibrio sp.]|nr:acyltransferase [Pseudobutyrivibrio sp.]